MMNFNGKKLMKHSNKKYGDSFVNDGGTLMNSMVLLDIFNDVYRRNFDMMMKPITIILLNMMTLNHKHWVRLKITSVELRDPLIGFMKLVATPLWPSVRMKLTLPKLGTWSPPGLPNL